MSDTLEVPVVEVLKIPLNHPLIGAYLAGEMTDEELINEAHIEFGAEAIAAEVALMFPAPVMEPVL
jgi:hypothetical protein